MNSIEPLQPADESVTSMNGISAQGISWRAALLIGFGAVILYGFTMYPDVGGASDSAELQIAGKVLGITHPTGYPVYCLISHLISKLAVSTLAARETFFSIICMAFSLTLLFILTQRLTASPLCSALAILWLAICYPAWAVGTVTEVYALQLLLTVSVFLVFDKYIMEKDSRFGYALAFLLGLGMAHHISTVFLIAGTGLTVFLVRRWLDLPSLNWKRVLFLFGIPLISYLYLPFRAAAGAQSFDLYSFSSLWDILGFILGGANTSMLQRNPFWLVQEGFLKGVVFYLDHFGVIPLALTVVGGYECLRRKRIVAFLLVWTIGIHLVLTGAWTATDREAIALPGIACAAVFLAYGLMAVRSMMIAWDVPKHVVLILSLVILLFAGLSAFKSYRSIHERNQHGGIAFFEKVFSVLPPKAVVLSGYWEYVNQWKYIADSGEFEEKDLRVYRWNDPRANADYSTILRYMNGKSSIGLERLLPDPSRRFFLMEAPENGTLPKELRVEGIVIEGGRAIYELHRIE